MKRSRRRGTLGRGGPLVVGLVALAVGCSSPTADSSTARLTVPDRVTSPGSADDIETDAATGSSTSLPTSWEVLWDVVDVIDGDTFVVDGPGGEFTVRMIGINTPEQGECFAEQATNGLRFFTDVGQVRLIDDVTDTDQYGRRLRYVEAPNGVDIGAELVRAGFALSRPYEPDIARTATYDAIQTEAESAGVGMWAADACGAATTGTSISLIINADAPGNDNDNLNAEWVAFTNDDANPLDLSGWQVADESASHRYEFAGLVLPPGATVTLYTGCGADTDTERYWCNTGSAVWNNSGDTVFLRDPSGNVVLSETYRG